MSNFTPQNMNAPMPPGDSLNENQSSLKEQDSKKSLDIGPPAKQINKVPQTKEVSNIQSIQGKFQNTTKSATNNTQQSMNTSGCIDNSYIKSSFNAPPEPMQNNFVQA